MSEKIKEITIIEDRIFTIRGQKVMIDRDLAELYGVELKRLNEAVKRNIKRFPVNFMFQLSEDEWENLRSQIATANPNISKVRFLPYVFTEHGVTMLASVLNSDRAIEISIRIVETFIALRQYAFAQTSKNKEIEELRTMLMLHIENTDKKFAQTDVTIKKIINVLNNLIEKPRETKKIGFRTEGK